MKQFIEFLKFSRQKKGLSTHKLADLSGISQSYLSHLENGRKKNPPSPEVIKKLAAALNVDYFELMRMAGYMDIGQNVITFQKAVNQLSEDNKTEILYTIFKNNPDKVKNNIEKCGLDEAFFKLIDEGGMFGDYLKVLRLAKGMSIRQLSHISGIEEETLLNIEKRQQHEPPIDILLKIGDALGIENFYHWFNENVKYQLYMDDLFSPFEDIHKDGKITVSFEVANIEETTDWDGKKRFRIIPKEELQERFFSLNFLLERNGNVYYKNRILTDQDREKIKKMLDILFD